MGFPTCCAVNCTHNCKQCKLKTFPKDERRAKIWERNMRRIKWERKKYHRLCECHFDASQFENNDGKRLRPDAVPHLFPTHNIEPKKTKKYPVLRAKDGSVPVMEGPPVYLEPLKSTESDMVEFLRLAGADRKETVQSFETNNCKQSIPKPTFILPKVDSLKSSTIPLTAENNDKKVFYIVTTPVLNSGASITSIQKEPDSKTNKLDDKEGTSSDPIKRLEKENSELRRENYRLKKKLTELSRICRNFNDDERAVLAGKKPKKWSDHTYNKCLEIRIAIGKKGYDFLVKQGYPLVSYSALCKYIQNLAEENESSQNAASLLEDYDVGAMSESAISSSSDEEGKSS